jgi:hypothetical protein
MNPQLGKFVETLHAANIYYMCAQNTTLPILNRIEGFV